MIDGNRSGRSAPPRPRSARLFCCLLLSLLYAPVLGAQETRDSTERQQTPATSEAMRRVDEIALAQELATVGRRKGYPLALAAAAQLLFNNPIRRLVALKRSVIPAATVASAARTKTTSDRPPLDPNRLIEEARRLATDATSASAVTAATRSRKPATRGATGGPRVLEDTLPANATIEYSIGFRVGEPAEVAVIGDGDAPIQCTARDASGALVARGRQDGARCMLRWTPTGTAPTTITVQNGGTVWNSFALVTN